MTSSNKERATNSNKGKIMRTIKISIPSGDAKMTLWEGTEDEESFAIKSLKRNIPYVIAYGVKYELTKEEIKYLRFIQEISSCVFSGRDYGKGE